MSKILVVSGHPRLNQSLANKTILETLKDKGADFTLLRLDEEGFAPQVEKDSFEGCGYHCVPVPHFLVLLSFSYEALGGGGLCPRFCLWHGRHGAEGEEVPDFLYHRFPCQCVQDRRSQWPSHGGFPL